MSMFKQRHAEAGSPGSDRDCPRGFAAVGFENIPTSFETPSVYLPSGWPIPEVGLGAAIEAIRRCPTHGPRMAQGFMATSNTVTINASCLRTDGL